MSTISDAIIGSNKAAYCAAVRSTVTTAVGESFHAAHCVAINETIESTFYTTIYATIKKPL